MSETLLTLNELLQATGGKLIGSASECTFTDIQTDSRNVHKNTLFVPLIGEFQDGHKYVPSAVEKGASVVYICQSEYEAKKDFYLSLAEETKVVIIAVDNTLYALQNTAEFYVAKFPLLTKVSITGSCGKTTTKECLVSLAKVHYGEENVAYTKGNFNSETGLPLSVFQIRKNHKIGIFEEGMNRENEIGEISKVLKSQYGIITNIGTAHIGILGSRENIAREKRKSLAYIPEGGADFIPEADDFADYCFENVKGKTFKVNEKLCGVEYLSDNGLAGCSFLLHGKKVNFPLSGKYNFYNALLVIACAQTLGFSDEEIKQGLENLSHLNGRMEIKKETLKNGKEAFLIEDCYNANPDSMKEALLFCAGLKEKGKKILVLADMKELGKESYKAHFEIGKVIANTNVDAVFLIGPEIMAAKDALEGRNNLFCYENKNEESFNEIAEKINGITEAGDVLLFKGSHSMELEKLIPLITGGEK